MSGPPVPVRSKGHAGHTDYPKIWYDWTIKKRDQYTQYVIDILKKPEDLEKHPKIQEEIEALKECIDNTTAEIISLSDKAMKTGNQAFHNIIEKLLELIKPTIYITCRNKLFEEKDYEDYSKWLETHTTPRRRRGPTPFSIQRKSTRKSARKSRKFTRKSTRKSRKFTWKSARKSTRKYTRK